MFASLVIVIGGCAFAVQRMRDDVEAARHNEVTQLRLGNLVEQLNGLEWQAAAQKGLSAEDSATAARVNTEILAMAHRAANATNSGPARVDLEATADTYGIAVREELDYYKVGDPSLAHVIDRTVTDPTAAVLRGLVVQGTANAEHVATDRSRKASSLTLLVAMIGGLVALMLLWRLDSGLIAARRAALMAEQASRLHEQASHDSLTGLPNRRQLLVDLQRALDREAPSALAFFDLDGFKVYNDTFGHTQGDLLLMRLGEKLVAAAGEGSTYRLGGDEFCALLPDDAQLEGAIAAIREALRDDGDSFVVTASYGLVRLPEEARDVTEALRLADTRMYEHKRSGRSSTATQATELARSVIAEHDDGLHAHSTGVAEMAVAVGRQLDLDEAQLIDLRRLAQLHDIGKVGVPSAILDRPGPLEEQERQFVKRHTLIGERILASAPALAHIARLVRSTHERFDGQGYPDGLAGDEIPLLSRIVFVCDALGAMTREGRPYGEALREQQARVELLRHSGTQFDPEVVDAAIQVLAAEASAERGPVRVADLAAAVPIAARRIGDRGA